MSLFATISGFNLGYFVVVESSRWRQETSLRFLLLTGVLQAETFFWPNRTLGNTGGVRKRKKKKSIFLAIRRGCCMTFFGSMGLTASGSAASSVVPAPTPVPTCEVGTGVEACFIDRGYAFRIQKRMVMTTTKGLTASGSAASLFVPAPTPVPASQVCTGVEAGFIDHGYAFRIQDGHDNGKGLDGFRFCSTIICASSYSSAYFASMHWSRSWFHRPWLCIQNSHNILKMLSDIFMP